MQLAQFIGFLTSIAQVGEPLWSLARDEMIPDSSARMAMQRAAFQFEMQAARAGDIDELDNARKLRQFLKLAPVGVDLSEMVV